MSKLPFAITLDPGTSLANHTGSWRTLMPVYVDRLPPCNQACPAGENIQAWLMHAEEGDYESAWRVLMRDNPLPGVMGRVCYHPCEDACNRGELDEAVGIHAVERFLGKMAWEQGWVPEVEAESSGQRVLVVGAGPSGLSAAYHLTRLGHAVTIREAGPMAGGMMRFGIPKYRLPRDVLDYEIQRILDMGVSLELNTKVEDIDAVLDDEGFDAVFVAVGAHLAKRIDIPAHAAGKILDAASVLRQMETDEEPPQLGRRVIVYGGGNTAMDAARTAKRLGVDEAMIVYRRSRNEMPAHDFEATEAEEEGVLIHWLRTIKQIDETTFTVEKMAIDENGRPQPTGEFETLEADTLILALGQDVDTTFLERVAGVEIAKDGVVSVIEMAGWTTVKRVETLGPGFFMRSHENTPYAWVDVFFGPHKDALHVIDKRTLDIVKTIRPAPGKTAAHVEFTRDGRFALVSVWEREGALVVYDAATLQEVKRIPMNKPSGKYNVHNKIRYSAGTSH